MTRGSQRVNRRVELFVARALVAALLVSVAACKQPKQELPAAPVEAKQAAPQLAPASSRQQRIAAMRQLVDRDPTNVKGWVSLGDEYFDSQQREKAIEAYGNALRLEPNNPDVLRSEAKQELAAAPVEAKQAAPQLAPASSRQQRIAAMRQLVDRDPTNVKGWVSLGDEYFDSQQREKAIEAYGNALRLEPNNPDVL